MDRHSKTDVLKHSVKIKPINIPLIETDHYFIYDILYHTASQWLIELGDRGKVNRNPPISLFEYVEGILELVDIGNLHLIVDYIIKEAGSIIDNDEFEYIKGKGVDNVGYRYQDTQKYVQFYITTG